MKLGDPPGDSKNYNPRNRCSIRGVYFESCVFKYGKQSSCCRLEGSGFIVVMSVFLYFSGNVDVLDLFYVIAVTDIALYSLYFF